MSYMLASANTARHLTDFRRYSSCFRRRLRMGILIVYPGSSRRVTCASACAARVSATARASSDSLALRLASVLFPSARDYVNNVENQETRKAARCGSKGGRKTTISSFLARGIYSNRQFQRDYGSNSNSNLPHRHPIVFWHVSE